MEPVACESGWRGLGNINERDSMSESSVKRNERIGRGIAQKFTGLPVKEWTKKSVHRDMMNAPSINTNKYQSINDAFDLWDEDYYGVSDTFRRCVPDAYFITYAGEDASKKWNHHCHHLCIVEIVTTNDVSERKMQAYGWIWDEFWCSDAWELQFLIVYTNTESCSYVNLQKWYYKAVTAERIRHELDATDSADSECGDSPQFNLFK